MKPSVAEAYRARVLSADAAVRRVKPGNRVFVGTACATPRTLVRALEALALAPADVELLHFVTDGALAAGAGDRVATRYRHRAFFVGSEMRAAMRQGVVEYVPLAISRLPELMRDGRVPVDVAFIQVTPPDDHGYVSLGVSVDVVAAAVECARLVIAERFQASAFWQTVAQHGITQVNLIAACSSDIMFQNMQFSLKVVDANTLMRLFPGMDGMEIKFVRCPAS